MIVLVVLLLGAAQSEKVDTALRKLEKEVAASKAEQETGLKAIEKLIKTPQTQPRAPRKCNVPDLDCPVCLLPELSRVDTRVDEVHIIDGSVIGAGTIWREYPQPEVMLTEFIFDHPIAIERENEPSAHRTALIVGLASGASFVLGVAVAIWVGG